jgi:hypothetical protein
VRRLVDRLTWPEGVAWDGLSRAQKGEVTKQQARVMSAKLDHKPLYYEHPLDHTKVKIGEVVHNYVDDDASWKVVFEINDGTPAGRSILTQVRDGKLAGLSLAHHTQQLEPIEVSLAHEGFRYDTGVEAELDDPFLQPKNTQSYIVETADDQQLAPPSDTPPVICASAVMQSLPRSSPPPPPPSQPQQQPPQQQQLQQQPPQQQMQQLQQQQPMNPLSAFLNDSQVKQPASSAQLSGSQEPQPSLQSSEVQQEPDATALLEKILTTQGGIASTDKKALIDVFTRMAKNTVKIQGELELARKMGAESNIMFHDALSKLMDQNKPANERMSEPEQQRARQLAVEDPKTYMNVMLPEVMRASARLDAAATAAARAPVVSQQQQQVYESQHVPPPVPTYDPELWNQFKSFKEVVQSMNTQTSSSAPYRMPQTMYASADFNNVSQQQQQQSAAPALMTTNKRSCYEGQRAVGVGQWYHQAGLHPSTVAVFRETEPVAAAGVGDYVRMQDQVTQQQRRQVMPSSVDYEQAAEKAESRGNFPRL